MFDDRAQTGSATETEPRYRGLALLGEGGTAEVFLAALLGPTGFSKLVVLEQLRQHLCEDAAFVELFAAEARLAARLHHPNVGHRVRTIA
jgi:serine/threonine-protein kinase